MPESPLFGLFPTPTVDDHDELVDLVRLAEAEGLDLVGIHGASPARPLTRWSTPSP